ncbi:hypothetical protein LIER_20352 [Lithospermum erythrorhizon]|uniref:Uncharacterized protein n=1 Tax=Lithospermum erythrorhizon TaxID=34254 RepID=A0AAV3QRV0_LITER
MLTKSPEKHNLENKKYKKRKLRKLSEARSSKPKEKLSKEERVAKKAKKAERRARKMNEELRRLQKLKPHRRMRGSPGVITISPKLMEGTQMYLFPLAPPAVEGPSGHHTDGTVQLLQEEIRYLNGAIQTTIARKSVLEARLRSLTRDDDPVENDVDA